MQRTAHATRLGFSSALCVVPSDSLSAPPSMCYSNALGSTVTVPSCPRAYPAACCSFLNQATRCWRNSACGCGLHIHEQSGQPRSEGFEKVRRFLVPSERPLWWSSLYSRASFLLSTICVVRRRSSGPPFPPDHRQAGELRAIIYYIQSAIEPDVTRRNANSNTASAHS